ncbi:hypothetical protein J6590_017923 [Homalodisca vitripennis]|nr:hypothetical protein J6590_017923 [Homalodisca vitripennis]
MKRADNEQITLLSLTDYLETDMNKKVILQIVLPPLNALTYIVKTYKIAPRAQNAIADVNGGFKFCVKKEDGFRVLERPSILFGGINPRFTHAYMTETFYNGKRLMDESTLQAALNILCKEVQPDYRLPDTKPQYRRGLTLALLYRAALNILCKEVQPDYRLPDTKPQYRRGLTLALLYRVIF